MGWRTLVLGCLLLALVAGPSCREATQITVVLHTNFESTASVKVAVWVEDLGQSRVDPTTRIDRPWGSDGALGSLVIVPPSGERERRVRVRAALSTEGSPEGCAQGAPNCVMAEREVRFESFEHKRVPIGLYRSCLGIACASGSTCNFQGRCVSSAVDGELCLSDQGCPVEGDPIAPPGVTPDAVANPAPVDAFVPPPLRVEAPLVSMRDGDPREGFLEGTAKLSLAAGGRDVRGYRLFWATATTRGPLFASVAAAADGTGTHTFLPGARRPADHAFLEVTAVAIDTYGQSAESPGTGVRADNFVRKADIGADAGGDALSLPQVLGDAQNNSLLFMGTSPFVTMRRCNFDGTGCTARQLSAELGGRFRFALDNRSPNGGLVGFVRGVSGLVFVRCARDGSGCTSTQGNPAVSYTSGLSTHLQGPWLLGHQPSVSFVERCNIDTGTCAAVPLPGLSTDTLSSVGGVVQDTSTMDLLLLARSSAGGPMMLYRCPASGATCVGTNIGLGFRGSLALDEPRRMLHVTLVSTSQAVSHRTRQCAMDTFSCSPVATTDPAEECVAMVDDATGDTLAVCGASDFSSAGEVFTQRCPQGGPCRPKVSIPDARPMWNASLATLNGQRRLLVGYVEGSVGRPWLVNCDVDGGDCARSDLSKSDIRGNSTSGKPALAFDEGLGRVHVVTTNASAGHRASLFTCDLEGEGCKHRTLEGVNGDGRDAELGYAPNVVLDPSRGTLTVVTSDGGRRGRASAYFCNREGEGCRFVTVQAALGPPEYSQVSGALIGNAQGTPRLLVGAQTQTKRLVLGCTLSGTDCRQHAAFQRNGDDGDVRGHFAWNAQQQAEFLTTRGWWRCGATDGTCTNVTPPLSAGGPVGFVLGANIVDQGGFARLSGSFGQRGLFFETCLGDQCNERLRIPTPSPVYFPQPASAAFDAKRGVRYFALGQERTQVLYRCPAWPSACEPIASWPDDNEATLGVVEAVDRLYIAAADRLNLSRPMLLMMDLY